MNRRHKSTPDPDGGGVLKKLTVAWLKEKGACVGGIEWFETCGKVNPAEVMDALLSEKKLVWANWLITQLLSPRDARAAWAAWEDSMAAGFADDAMQEEIIRYWMGLCFGREAS
ncbi:MAG: hypothetical protein E6Q97_38885 [Desulfurellales bacterium]|nr:MAG: hypothetical protein E6Q97_38885 [Desulfurellales bacterium]